VLSKQLEPIITGL